MKLLLSIFICSIIFYSCLGENKPRVKYSKQEISTLIHNKANLDIDTTFQVLQDSVEIIEFDYSQYITLKVTDSDTDSLQKQIESTQFFNAVQYQNFNDTIWKHVKKEGLMGIWAYKENGYYLINSQELKQNIIKVNLDTVKNILDFTLIHI